jgi:sigma54-dependent transcription regulator
VILKDYAHKKNKKTMTMEKAFTEWLDHINEIETVDNSIIGFNFGLFETTNGFEMYLIGSKKFEIDDEDWATHVDFEPKQKYFQFGNEFSADKDWQAIQQLSEKLIRSYVASEKFKTSLFANANGITTGFDDGNLTVINVKD